MGNSASIWLIILLAVLAANLPFLNERCFAIIALQRFAFLKSMFSRATGDVPTSDLPVADSRENGLVFSSSDGSLEKPVDVQIVKDASAPIVKSLWLRIFELIILYFCVGAIAFLLEAAAGNRFPQRWEFYTINACLFLVLAFPGFVFRYLKHHRG